MVRENLQILLELYYRPLRALSSVLDKGNVLFAVVAAILANILLGMVLGGQVSLHAPKHDSQASVARPAPANDDSDGPEQPPDLGDRLIGPYVGGPLSGVTALVPVALFFVPAAIVIAGWIAGLGGAGVLIRRDYMPMLACAMMVWTASHIPAALLALAPAPAADVAAVAAGQVLFLAYSAASVRTVMGTNWGQAIGTTLLAAIVMGVGQVLYSVLGNGSFYFASPFVLYYVYMMVQQDVRLMSGGLSSRQSLRRHLEASTLNPRDYDAHYQLGLIYQQRRNYPEAIARFEKAIEIAPKEEADAHYQLGRIAREQGRHEDARKCFAAALEIDEKHSSSEVWRDLGATDYELGRVDLALPELEKFVDRRGYDAEGLYWLGMTLKKLGRAQDAKEAFERSVEAARTAPSHRRRQTGKWGGLAQGELRGLKG